MPIIEEIDDIDDIDNMDMDLAELDSSLNTPVAPKIVPTVVRSQDQEEKISGGSIPSSTDQEQAMHFINPSTGKIEKSNALSKDEMNQIKEFQLLYPCYFDRNRSSKQGRRIPTQYCVENPLAKTIADAARFLGLPSVFEGSKTHPQDFGNPGRVRVLIKENGQAFDKNIPTKRALMLKISEYMKTHPTKLESLRELPYGPDYDNFEPRNIPQLKGAVMNEIVPLHSPFSMGHPMTKSLYDAPAPAISTQPEKQFKMPKNKFRVVRR